MRARRLITGNLGLAANTPPNVALLVVMESSKMARIVMMATIQMLTTVQLTVGRIAAAMASFARISSQAKKVTSLDDDGNSDDFDGCD